MRFSSDEMTVTDIDNVMTVRGSGLKEPTCKIFGPRRYHGLVMQLHGQARYEIEGQRALIHRAGEILYLPQGQPYRVYAEENGICCCVNFFLSGAPEPVGLLCRPQQGTVWQNLFHELENLWTRQQRGYRAHSIGMLYQMLAEFENDLAERTIPAAYARSLERAVQFIEENYSRSDLTAEEIIAVSAMNAVRFRQLFGQLYGLTPRRYLINTRIAHAKALLTSTDLSVTEIAEKSGFESLYHFSKCFKAAAGTSPLGYRREYGP